VKTIPGARLKAGDGPSQYSLEGTACASQINEKQESAYTSLEVGKSDFMIIKQWNIAHKAIVLCETGREHRETFKERVQIGVG